MSFKSKWRQFVGWVREHSVRNDENEMLMREERKWFDQTQITGGTGPGDNDLETMELAELQKRGAEYWVMYGMFAASYFDSKLGTGKQLPPNSGPITGNNNGDMLILVGGAIGFLWLVTFLFKKLF